MERLNESQRVAPGSFAGNADGTLAGPHWNALIQSGELRETKKPAQGEVLAALETKLTALGMEAEVFPAGVNGALQRTPKLETQALPMLRAQMGLAAWKPTRTRVPTYGVSFPEGFDFLPKKPEKTEGEAAAGEALENGGKVAGAPPEHKLTDLIPLKPPGAPEGEAAPGEEAAAAAEGEEEKEKPKTKIRPPAGAISLEDRLFYLLQPPLQTWLKGQELIMPFEPFPYQYEGIAWLFSHDSGLLADEMGLGKTMQTITAMRLLLRAGTVNRILLVCPKPLLPNWQREFQNWAEELPFVVVEGDTDRRKLTWTMPGVPILIVNYETLVRDFANFPEGEFPKFDLVVLDEAQRIKNRTSRTAETARGIPRKRSWALTGTPIENRPEEMVALYEFMRIVPEAATPDLKQLQSLSKEYVLRRTKDLVMKDMPPRLDRDALLPLSPAQQQAYDAAEKDGVIQLNEMGDSITVQHVFELVLRLKQICNWDPLTKESSKYDRLEADMEEIAASGGKAILFSQWTRTLDWLAPKLARFNPLIYHGGIPTKHREPVLKKFKEDPDAHIILMSYATGAVGLNLQFAGYVFLFDRWWNPAIEDQAINRAHRIGCKSQVIVTRFISQGTIEERIDRVLNEKRELFRAILGEGDNTNASLSMNASEIFGLFDLKARAGKGTRSIQPQRPA